MPMVDVVLHGQAEKMLGGPYRLLVDTPAEAARALMANFGNKAWALFHHGHFKIRRSRGAPFSDDFLSTADLRQKLGRCQRLDIIPHIAGSGGGGRSKGILQIIVGVVIIIASIYTGGLAAEAAAAAEAGEGGAAAVGTWSAATLALPVVGAISYGSIAAFGATLVLGGIASLISPVGTNSGKSDGRSFMYDGPSNSSTQGGALPIIYGRMRVGSVIVSAGVTVENIDEFYGTPGDTTADTVENSGYIGPTPGNPNGAV